MIDKEDQTVVKELLDRKLVDKETFSKFQNVVARDIPEAGISKTLIKYFKTDEQQIAELISDKFDVPLINDTKGISKLDVASIDMEEISSKYKFIPIISEDKELTIAIMDPPYQRLIEFLSKVTKRKIIPVILKTSDFDRVYEKSMEISDYSSAKKINFESIDVSKKGERWAQEAESTGTLPAANKVLDAIVENAVNFGASDVHFEPDGSGFLTVRYRLDSVLHRIVKLPKSYNSSIPNILKQRGSIDSLNRKSIQEGQNVFEFKGKKVHTRIGTLPTRNGENITIRILKKSLSILSMDELGLSVQDYERLNQLLTYPGAIILFTGPSGCGKTTTMYSALSELNKITKKIATVERPIESVIEGINQTSVAPNKDYSFTDAVRAVFHHDVDVLCVGEIRSKEEGDLLIEAGLTGMMACTTVQAASAIKSLYRLKNFGLEQDELALVLRGVVAQNFVRKVCPNCSEEYFPEPELLERIGLSKLSKDTPLKRGKGCSSCLGTGYMGRIPLFEILIVNNTISSLIHNGKSYGELKQAAERIGFTSMRYDGIRKIIAGFTTIEEVVRVT